jgi:hypothetical protein
MALVQYGNHRTIAILILAKRGSIEPGMIVGEHMGQALTAGELVRLYETGQLETANSNYRGLPWFSDGKVTDIVQNFDPAELFNPGRDGGRGVVLSAGSGAPFREMKGDYGYGVPVEELISTS